MVLQRLALAPGSRGGERGGAQIAAKTCLARLWQSLRREKRTTEMGLQWPPDSILCLSPSPCPHLIRTDRTSEGERKGRCRRTCSALLLNHPGGACSRTLLTKQRSIATIVRLLCSRDAHMGKHLSTP